MGRDLRVLSGQYKRQRILAPLGEDAHPMGARERLALFNLLSTELVANGIAAQDAFVDLAVLDAFAGTGALGIEALSRGAKTVCFVEQERELAERIQRTLAGLKPMPTANACRVVPQPVERFVHASHGEKPFDLILADPPYGNFQPTLIMLLAQLLRSHGILALSFPAQMGAAPALAGLELLVERKYAAAGIALYRR